MALTEKQKKFIDYYIELGNAMEAAKRAGYKQPQVQGAQNLEKLRDRVNEKLQSKEDERIAKQDEVLRYLTSVMRGEHTEQAPILCGNGYQEMVDKDVSAKERIKAAELLGKRYSLFTDKINIDGDVSLDIKIDYGDDDGD